MNSPSTVLVTGAFGNLGPRLLTELKARGYHVVAMDLDTSPNRKTAGRVAAMYDEVHWGDIRRADWNALLPGVSAVLHFASMLPPATDRLADVAKGVNLDATLQLIETLERQETPAQLVFPSSVTVFGYPVGPELKRASDPPRPSENYTHWKVVVEERLAASCIPWSVLRVGVSVDGNLPATDKEMTQRQFATSPDNPVEYVHPADVALAAVNALNNPEALGRVWLIGGGPRCRMTQYDLLSAPFEAMGVSLPLSMFGNGEFYTHWMDTGESERVLRFQRHSFDDFRAELRGTIGRWRPLLRPFAPLVRWGLRRYLRAG